MSFHRAKAALVGTRFADLRSVADTGSTNADMRSLLDDAALAGAGSTAPIVLLADHQSAGRGRLDRTWQAPAGSSVLMSIGLPVAHIPQERRSLLTTCLALSVTDATAALGVASVQIKWPNDLVVDPPTDEPIASAADAGPGYRKIGGILAELYPVDGLGDCMILGIGLNVNWPEIPDELSVLASSLNSLAGHELDRDDLVIELLTSLDRVWLPALDGSGSQRLGGAYAERSATLGRDVRIELPVGQLEGRALRVTPDGALVVLDTDGVEHTVTVGDVVHLRPIRGR